MIVRLATFADVAALETLIDESGLSLSRGFYSAEQARALTELVYGVDTRLIADGTYFVIEADGAIVAAGGWSRRRNISGGDAVKRSDADALLDPAVDAARIRAFFVAPSHARRGLGSRLMQHCAAAAWHAGFRSLTLLATLPGEPLYRAFGFVEDERYEEMLTDDIRATAIRMSRPLDGPHLVLPDDRPRPPRSAFG